jgi:hypothetical protein
MCYSNGARFSASFAPHQRRRGPPVPVPPLSSLFPFEPPAPRRRLAPLPALVLNDITVVDLGSCRLNSDDVRFVELDVLFDLFGDRDFAADFMRSDALPIFQRQVHQQRYELAPGAVET